MLCVILLILGLVSNFIYLLNCGWKLVIVIFVSCCWKVLIVLWFFYMGCILCVVYNS